MVGEALDSGTRIVAADESGFFGIENIQTGLLLDAVDLAHVDNRSIDAFVVHDRQHQGGRAALCEEDSKPDVVAGASEQRRFGGHRLPVLRIEFAIAIAICAMSEMNWAEISLCEMIKVISQMSVTMQEFLVVLLDLDWV